jgi:hypothetical protein
LQGGLLASLAPDEPSGLDLILRGSRRP